MLRGGVKRKMGQGLKGRMGDGVTGSLRCALVITPSPTLPVSASFFSRWRNAFLGTLLVLAGLAAALYLGSDMRTVLPWTSAAFALYLAAVVITLAVNVPLNDALKAAGDPDRIGDLGSVRERFNETRWAAWNLIRAVTSTAAFGCLIWALVTYGRT